MLEFLGNVIYVLVIAVSILVVTYCVIGKIGDEYRKNTEYAAKSLDQVLAKLPDAIVTCIETIETSKEAQKKKTQTNATEPKITLSSKSDNWGII